MDAVRRRGIFFVGGYDPKSSGDFFRRLSREIGRFDRLWDVSSRVTPSGSEAAGEVGKALIETEAADWSVECEFYFLVLEDLVLRDFSRPLHVRLRKYLRAFADLVSSGALFRYFAWNWRFGVYTLFPFVMLLVFAAIGLAVGGLVWSLEMPLAAPLAAPLAGPLSGPLAGAAGLLAGSLAFVLCIVLLGRRWPVLHLMDLWSFSVDFLHGRRPDAEALFGRWADFIVARVAAGRFDEVLLVGHSTGGVIILDVAAKCLERDAEFATRSSVSIMTLGSTALKAGLHPAAKGFRSKVQTLADCPCLSWIDVQSRLDVINFHRANAVKAMKLRPPAAKGFLLRCSANAHQMLDRAAYRRIRWNLFRIHYQYVYGNTVPFYYDFFMICCGPMNLRVRIADRLVGPHITETPA